MKIKPLALALLVNSAQAGDYYLDPPIVQPNPAWKMQMIWFWQYTQYVRPDADWKYPTAIYSPTVQYRDGNICIPFEGWGYTDIHPHAMPGCDVTILNVYSHYPLQSWPETQLHHTDLDFGGVLHGVDYNGRRLVATLNELAQNGYRIDYGAGVQLGGNCYGGSAAITQSLILPDPFWQSRISVIDAELPGMTADAPFGKYWRGQTGWNPYDITLAQHALHLDKLYGKYYHLYGSSYPADEIGYDQNFIRDVCEKGIMCYAVWGDQNHAWPDPKAPREFQLQAGRLYSGPDMKNRLDHVGIAFTNATSNWYVPGAQIPRGHYNLGMEWNDAGIRNGATLVVPIRYRRFTDLGEGIPNQPLTTTFKLWLNRHGYAPWTKLHWTFGNQSGETYVRPDGNIVIPNLTLGADEVYTDMELTYLQEGC